MSIKYEVTSFMSEDIISVETTDNLSDVVRLMVEKDIGSVVVSRGGKPEGIITERDVSKRFSFDTQCSDLKAEVIMSSPLITIDGSASIGEAATVMKMKKIRRLIVTEEGKIQGLITERDIMRGTLNVFKALENIHIGEVK